MTYPLHVILRHRLERALIAGELEVADLPAAWNDCMRELLGITPPDDRLGCLQDIHWPGGSFGYFPCYTLGAMLAAQLFRAALAQVPGPLDAIGQGDFSPLLAWLRERVHGQGCLPRNSLIWSKSASGGPLVVEPFLAHLRGRVAWARPPDVQFGLQLVHGLGPEDVAPSGRSLDRLQQQAGCFRCAE